MKAWVSREGAATGTQGDLQQTDPGGFVHAMWMSAPRALSRQVSMHVTVSAYVCADHTPVCVCCASVYAN